MRILHSGDWHIGSMKGPERDGVNLRLEDTIRCLEEMVRVAEEEKPELVLVAGDIFHQAEIWQGRSHRELHIARSIIKKLSEVSREVIVMRGTPNHDAAEIFMSLTETFERFPNVKVVTQPQVVQTEYADIVVIPGFDKGQFRAKFPGLSKEEENAAFSGELGNMVVGMKAMCREGQMAILMSHYTVPGCNTESGQVQMFTQAEPVITQEMLQTAGYDLVTLGHIHRPQFILGFDAVCYSGAINAFNFNDEGQERGFWIHREQDGMLADSVFHKTPYREFLTIRWDKEDVGQAVMNPDVLPMVFSQAGVADKIVRIIYSCTEEQKKAINTAQIERALYEAGAFYKADIIFDVVEDINRTKLSKFDDPEANLIKYFEEKQIPPDKIPEMVMKARPIIAEAEANMPTSVNHGTFEPVEIAVKNYRNYEDETFNFQDITFCTINGQNGAGKSSLFMDAIIDCLYEQPREGVIKDDTGKSPWLRNDESVRSGYIMFTFRIGEKKYRVTRTRARSGKGTLNISYFADGSWEDCSKERYNDTQQEILNIIGMDSFTFKSCALIMQDQYGLFLQAKPVERVEVLGTLLGLSVYQIMERIAQDKAKVYGAKNRELKQEVEIHHNTISGFGDPDQELAVCRTELAEYENSLQVKSAERDKHKLLLANRQEAAERHRKLLVAITTLQDKKDATGQNRDVQQAVIESCSVVLNERPEIEAKVVEYNSLLEKEKELSAEATLYSSKQTEAAELEKQVRDEEVEINDLKEKLQSAKDKKAALEIPVDENDIRDKNAEYEKYSKLLRQTKELQTRFIEAKSERNRKAYAVDSKKAYINQETVRLNSKKTDLERRTDLLQNSGCPNIENAECRFLSDALEAKKQLPMVEAEIISFQEEQKPLLQELIALVDEAEKAILDVGYDEKLLTEYTAKVKEFSDAPEQLKKLEERTNQIALISASIEYMQSNISNCEKRLVTVKLKASTAAQDRDKYKTAFEEYIRVQSNIQILKPWIDREKQLPVAEERKATAMRRVLELDEELAGITAEIGEKQAEADKEALDMNGMEALAGIVARMNAEVDAVNALVKEKQMQIGALQQKSEQISKLKKEIVELQEKQVEYAKEEADYEVLKVAFSQSGVPHQIIRSIIPKLTATSNTILGQMTGGKMGVEFRLERLQKNKEKASLDIYIEEYRKSTLPYLSKSGGEKVKSSLAVILALAEIKSCSAGIQLGMLFIDEAPFLDGESVQAYVDALETIQQRYADIKVMAITHDPTFKARFPQSISVVKDEQGSHVRWD